MANIGINLVEVDGRATPSIQGASTSVAGFLMRTERGVPGKVRNVTNMSEFIEYFGGEHEGEFPIAKRWAVEKGLGFGLLPLFDDPDVQASFAQWIDPALLKEQAQKARSSTASLVPGVTERAAPAKRKAAKRKAR